MKRRAFCTFRQSFFTFACKIKNALRFGDKRKAVQQNVLSGAESIIIVVKSNRVHKILKIKAGKIIQDSLTEMQTINGCELNTS